MPPLQIKRKRWENACNAHLLFYMKQNSKSPVIIEISPPKSTETTYHKQSHVFCQRFLRLLDRCRFAKPLGEILEYKQRFPPRLDTVHRTFKVERMPAGSSSVRRDTLACCETELAL